MEDEKEWVVWGIWNNHSRAPSGMLAEHLKEWLKEVRKAEAAAEKASDRAAKATGGPGEDGTEVERDMGN